MNPVTALWIIAVPLIDMVAIIYRRLRKGKSPFRPDRLHVHHLMVRAGLTSRQAFLLITFFAAICATIGILGEVFYINEWAMFYCVYCIILPLCLFNYKSMENHPMGTKNEASRTS